MINRLVSDTPHAETAREYLRGNCKVSELYPYDKEFGDGFLLKQGLTFIWLYHLEIALLIFVKLPGQNHYMEEYEQILLKSFDAWLAGQGCTAHEEAVAALRERKAAGQIICM